MKKKLIAFASLLSIFVVAIACYYSLNDSNEKVSIIHGDFAMDVTKKNEVVGNSENVFVAKVIEQVGNGNPYKGDRPYSQFKVEIIKNIKGTLKKDVIVNQSIGYITNSEGEQEFIKYEDQELLAPGKIYLFATMHDERIGWHNTVPVYGEVKISEATMTEVIKEYTVALKNQTTSDLVKRHKEKDFVNGYHQN
ncbi:hypothetical protein [Cohnella panacarvi]|uniref:hypothetical protein n=1 Tax=Cohnella panacarvi TaxID=400776 RepID=UPI00047915B6|nr:hypothetical protein [Cohnella panacarvi]